MFIIALNTIRNRMMCTWFKDDSCGTDDAAVIEMMLVMQYTFIEAHEL